MRANINTHTHTRTRTHIHQDVTPLGTHEKQFSAHESNENTIERRREYWSAFHVCRRVFDI